MKRLKEGVGFVYGSIFDRDGITLPGLCHFSLAKELMFAFGLTGGVVMGF